jgi:DNA-binding PadR family transcriptional regulator
MYELTGFQRDAMYVIAGRGEPHGLAIKEGLEDYYDFDVHHGRLYPNLDTLVEEGMVEKGDRDERTNYYTLTDRGERELRARRKWEDRLVDL